MTARPIEETFVPGASVAAVAQRHEVNANLLFKWLRQAGRGRRDAARTELTAAEPPAPAFVSLGVVAHDARTGGPVLRLPTAEVSPRSAPSPMTATLQQRCG